MATELRSISTRSVRSVRRRTPRAVRRARTLTVLFVLGLLAMLFFFPRLVHTQGHELQVPGVEHTVMAGDTLWEIATLYAGRRDVREVIYRIEQANGLSSSNIQPGQVLFVPTPSNSTWVRR